MCIPLQGQIFDLNWEGSRAEINMYVFCYFNIFKISEFKLSAKSINQLIIDFVLKALLFSLH